MKIFNYIRSRKGRFSGMPVLFALAFCLSLSHSSHANPELYECCWRVYPSAVCVGDTVTVGFGQAGSTVDTCNTYFNSTHSVPDAPAGVSFTSVLLHWGDGTTSPVAYTASTPTNGANVIPNQVFTKTYSSSGQYYPYITWARSDGNSGSVSVKTTWDCGAPGIVTVGLDTNLLHSDYIDPPYNPSPCMTGSNPGWDITYHFWLNSGCNSVSIDWGNGQSSQLWNVSSGGHSKSTTYYQAGTYTVTVTYTTNCGSFSVTHVVEIGPVNTIFYAQSNCNNTNVVFNPDPDCDNANHLFRLVWNFGDGSQAIQTGSNAWNTISHTYSTHGSYTVTLQVQQQDANNQWVTVSSYTEVVEIATLPYLQINSTFTNLCEGDSLNFWISNFSAYGSSAQFSVLDPNNILASSTINGAWISVQATGPGVFYVQVTQPGCPTRIVPIHIYDCCRATPGIFDDRDVWDHLGLGIFDTSRSVIDLDNTSLLQAISGGLLPAGGIIGNNGVLIRVNGTLTIDTDYLIDGCRILLGPEARMAYASGTPINLSIKESVLQACSDRMWDGIYLEGSLQTFEIGTSYVMESDNGIVSKQEARVTVHNSHFLANWKSLQVFDHVPPGTVSPFPPTQILCTNCISVTNSRFNVMWPDYSSLNVNGNSYLLLPYDGGLPPGQVPWPRGHASVFIQNSQGVQIGGGNTFANTAYGIIARDADVTSKDNEFRNLAEHPYSIFNYPFWGAGIYAYRAPANILVEKTYIPKVRVIDGGSGGNVFWQCKLGMFTEGVLTQVSDAEFTDNYDGVIIRNPRHYSLGGTTHYSKVEHSVFRRVSHAGPLRSAIRVRNIFPTWSPAKVKNDSIDGYRHGVVATNLEGYKGKFPEIMDNIISYNDPSHTGLFSGIYLEGCVGARVKGNDISRPLAPSTGSPPQWWGITTSESQKCIITQNTMQHMAQAIRCAGNLHDTKYTCNDFDACNHGFYFVHGNNVATYVSDQYRLANCSGVDAGNRWLNHPAGPYRMAGDVNNPSNDVDWFFTGAGGPSLQTHNPHIHSQYTSPGLYLAFVEHPNTPANPSCASITQVPGNELKNIKDSLIAYKRLVSESVYRAEEYAYRELYYEDEWRDEATTEEMAMENYYQSLDSRNLGTFLEDQQLIEEGEFVQARTLISGIVSENLIETAKRDAFSAYLDEYVYGQQQFSPQTEAAMMALAMQTPYVHGEGTFYARVMLGLLTPDLAVPYRAETPAPEASDDDWGRVYPNPVGREAWFVPEEVLEVDLQVVVSDVQGRMVWASALRAGEALLRIPGKNWASGVYLITITGPDKVQVERLVKE